ncbi:hypothetical protein F4779DRAFT_340333 [Xylariaceae sp. FL0662B]|nr:hypothetical protein F4779DRAFT_340333 [Xylariaceae sp. FL0662B]
MDRDDEDDGSGTLFESYPFAWILVPLIVLVIAGTVFSLYRYRRWQKLRMLYSSGALERDLEVMGRRERPRAPNNSWIRRGQYSSGQLGLRAGGQEEGLNELGEPPPAYTAPRKRPEDTEGIELTPVAQPAGTTTVAAGTSSPPAYDEAQRVTDQRPPIPPASTTNTPTSPPRVVLGPT